jgi:hypothetical protein
VISVPAGAAIGDTLVLVMCEEIAFSAPNGATGFTIQTPPSQPGTGAQPSFKVYTQKLVATPPASYSLTGSGAVYGCVFYMLCLRNLHATTLLSGTTRCSADDPASATTPLVCPSFTPADNGAFLISVGIGRSTGTFGVLSANGFTQQATAVSDGATNDTRSILMTKFPAATTSSFSPPSYTQSVSSSYRVAVFGLKPA